MYIRNEWTHQRNRIFKEEPYENENIQEKKNQWIKEIQVNRNSIIWASGKIFYLKIDKASGICGTIIKNACKGRPKRRGDRKVQKYIWKNYGQKSPKFDESNKYTNLRNLKTYSEFSIGTKKICPGPNPAALNVIFFGNSLCRWDEVKDLRIR